jgi:acyl-CoA thioesterase FadM
MVRKSDGLLVMNARTEFVFVGREGRPVKIPEAFRKAFS